LWETNSTKRRSDGPLSFYRVDFDFGFRPWPLR